MLRYAALHFEALKPYRWRLCRMIDLTKPAYAHERRALEHALAALDRAAMEHLSAEDYAAFTSPWFPPDQV